MWVRLGWSSALASPKSVTQTVPLGVQEQVRRLDVPVLHPLLVGVLQGLRHLDADARHALPVRRLPALRPAAIPAPPREHDRGGRQREGIRRRRPIAGVRAGSCGRVDILPHRCGVPFVIPPQRTRPSAASGPPARPTISGARPARLAYGHRAAGPATAGLAGPSTRPAPHPGPGPG